MPIHASASKGTQSKKISSYSYYILSFPLTRAPCYPFPLLVDPLPHEDSKSNSEPVIPTPLPIYNGSEAGTSYTSREDLLQLPGSHPSLQSQENGKVQTILCCSKINHKPASYCSTPTFHTLTTY